MATPEEERAELARLRWIVEVITQQVQSWRARLTEEHATSAEQTWTRVHAEEIEDILAAAGPALPSDEWLADALRQVELAGRNLARIRELAVKL